jgi:hypothetical protein
VFGQRRILKISTEMTALLFKVFQMLAHQADGFGAAIMLKRGIH